MAKSHVTKVSIAKLHKCQKQTEDGACLTGHEGDYKKKNSCSYRWQAHEISLKERADIYDGISVPDAPKGGIKTSAFKTKKGTLHPAGYVKQLAKPGITDGVSDWDLNGPGKPLKRKSINNRNDTIPKGKNFTKDRWPYWHNAHHLIPKSLLREVITSTGVGDKANPQAPAIIRKCLLVAKYNVNHTTNMIILPQDREVGKILGLPRHLILVEISGDKDQLVRKEVACHKAYDRFVENRLKQIMSDFASRIDKKNCVDEEDPEAHKGRLEDLSEELYGQIKEFGADRQGKPIADMAKEKSPKPAIKTQKLG